MTRYLLTGKIIGIVLFLVAFQGPGAFAFGAKKGEGARAASQGGNDSSVVWVTRKDGATSCGLAQGQTLEAGAQELKSAGIKVLDSRKGNDGKMHAQACGMPTGSLNEYQISKEDLAKALSLGFEQEKRK